MGVYRSGQTGQTVNLLDYSYVGSNPTAPIHIALVRISSRTVVFLRITQQVMFVIITRVKRRVVSMFIAPRRIGSRLFACALVRL